MAFPTTKIGVYVDGADKAAADLQKVAAAEKNVANEGNKTAASVNHVEDALQGAANAGNKAADSLKSVGNVSAKAGKEAEGAFSKLEGGVGKVLGKLNGIGDIFKVIGLGFAGGAAFGGLQDIMEAMSGLADATGITKNRLDRMIESGQALDAVFVGRATGIKDVSTALDEYAVSLGKASKAELTYLEEREGLKRMSTGEYRPVEVVRKDIEDTLNAISSLRGTIGTAGKTYITKEGDEVTRFSAAQVSVMESKITSLESRLKELDAENARLVSKPFPGYGVFSGEVSEKDAAEIEKLQAGQAQVEREKVARLKEIKDAAKAGAEALKKYNEEFLRLHPGIGLSKVYESLIETAKKAAAPFQGIDTGSSPAQVALAELGLRSDGEFNIDEFALPGKSPIPTRISSYADAVAAQGGAFRSEGGAAGSGKEALRLALIKSSSKESERAYRFATADTMSPEFMQGLNEALYEDASQIIDELPRMGRQERSSAKESFADALASGNVEAVISANEALTGSLMELRQAQEDTWGPMADSASYALASMTDSAMNIGSVMIGVVDQFTGAVGSMMTNFILSGESGGKAIWKTVGNTLAAISAQAFGYATLLTAFGIAASIPAVGAIMGFAGPQFFAGAAVMGGAGLALAGTARLMGADKLGQGASKGGSGAAGTPSNPSLSNPYQPQADAPQVTVIIGGEVVTRGVKTETRRQNLRGGITEGRMAMAGA